MAVDPPDAGEIGNLAAQLGMAATLIVATTAIHGAGLFALGRALRVEREMESRFTVDFNRVTGLAFTIGLVLLIIALHFVQIALYALFYWLTGAIDHFAQALYFSTITFGTVGYDDHGLAPDFQMVAAFEGLNGIVLLGWSTAFFVRALGRLSRYGG